MSQQNRYNKIIESIFMSGYKRGIKTIEFERQDIEKHAEVLKLDLPKNIGDIIYSFRYRTPLPKKVREKALKG